MLKYRMPPSSSGLGQLSFTEQTGIRFPLGVPVNQEIPLRVPVSHQLRFTVTNYIKFFKKEQLMSINTDINTFVLAAIPKLEPGWQYFFYNFKIKIFTGMLSQDDIWDVLWIVFWIRFAFLIIRHNIYDTLCILIIAGICSQRWMICQQRVMMEYGDCFKNLHYTKGLVEDLYIHAEKDLFRTPIQTINPLEPIVDAFKNLLVDNRGRYWVDPISIWIRALLNSLDRLYNWELTHSWVWEFLYWKIHDLYYFLYREAIPFLYVGFLRYFREVKDMTFYTLVTRVYQKYCPYLIRWHWTMVITVLTATAKFAPVIRRSIDYLDDVLIVEYQHQMSLKKEWGVYNSRLAAYYSERIDILAMFLISIAGFAWMWTIYGMLQASCSQYFYFPLFTETTELHIGKFPEASNKFGGGYAPWNESAKKRPKRPPVIRKFLKKFLRKLLRRLRKDSKK